MDMTFKFSLLRTSTSLFEILSLFEFFFMRKIQVMWHNLFGLPGIPLPRTGGAERSAPLQFRVRVSPIFSPQDSIESRKWLQQNDARFCSSKPALICASFIKFLSSALSVLFVHGIIYQQQNFSYPLLHENLSISGYGDTQRRSVETIIADII